jgi:hypothetical protein
MDFGDGLGSLLFGSGSARTVGAAPAEIAAKADKNNDDKKRADAAHASDEDSCVPRSFVGFSNALRIFWKTRLVNVIGIVMVTVVVAITIQPIAEVSVIARRTFVTRVAGVRTCFAGVRVGTTGAASARATFELSVSILATADDSQAGKN